MPGPSATFIQPPEPFTFTKPQEWERWIRRFEPFRQANSDKPALQTATKPLLGPGCAPLDVIGVTKLPQQKGDKQSLEVVYVIKSLHTALLGRPAISKLGLVTCVESIDIQTLKDRYPKMCSELGLIQRPYTIEQSKGRAVLAKDSVTYPSATNAKSQELR
ncbi:hypothetical protein SKAU_G00016190 [Synaphobranchus kaupii]|uniref:Uncharacterized protein n=1 Tax=Synaphobranchus kaupii TaxID=118154 RepID=A0A9Q1GC70_SYNKA|nr:hypothetical protein SKAU_G00016190 [Synaphobranchus kaupii]